MSAPNSPEQRSEGEEVDPFSEEATASAELVFDEASLGEVDELDLNKNGHELAPLEFLDLELLEIKQCTDIIHCREIMYTIIK